MCKLRVPSIIFYRFGVTVISIKSVAVLVKVSEEVGHVI